MVKPNFPELGDHVASASFVVAAEVQGRGIGRAMAERALTVVRDAGYTAMQFNRVVASNETAARLWQKLGFAIIGRSPGAYRHPTLGPVDALIMHRTF